LFVVLNANIVVDINYESVLSESNFVIIAKNLNASTISHVRLGLRLVIVIVFLQLAKKLGEPN